MSSDDEEDVPPKPTNQVSEVTVEQPISEEEYRRMLRKHRKRRMRSKVRVQQIKYHNINFGEIFLGNLANLVYNVDRQSNNSPI